MGPHGKYKLSNKILKIGSPSQKFWGDKHKKNTIEFDNLLLLQKSVKNRFYFCHSDFQGLDLSDEKPPKLTYTIRMYEDFKTYSYISEDVYIGPHYGFGKYILLIFFNGEISRIVI